MKITIRKRYLFFVLVFSSAIITAIFSGVDAVTQLYIPNPWVLGLVCFIFGILISLFFSLILSIPFKGKSLGSRTITPYYWLFYAAFIHERRCICGASFYSDGHIIFGHY
jgi:hypothetical protein